ncbi:MAG TPA: GntR family transcriptional regulator [Ktedonobacteraceae bacterium]|nr:GntR family transcriptional regulator [Ktedonobacteraceae bacterium]
MIFIDEQSKEPIYRQIVEQVRRHVATGVLAPGDELPSLRQLAVDLNVHLNTIALAYRELERQGILRLRQGSRATIVPVDRAKLAPPPQALVFVREQLERIRTEALLSGITLSEVRQLADKIFADLPPDGNEVL